MVVPTIITFAPGRDVPEDASITLPAIFPFVWAILPVEKSRTTAMKKNLA
jgi:hypothetical protein